MKSINQLFDEHAIKRPKAVAVQIRAKNITYSELKGSVENIINQMALFGVKAGEPVGLFIDISADMVAGYLAILSNGCIVVPIDPESPPKRRQIILQDSNLKFCLTQDKFCKTLTEEGVTLISIDQKTPTTPIITRQAEERVANTPDDPALIVYTSGSTGHPKGVIISHGNLVHYVTALKHSLKIKEQDAYLLRGSISLIVSARQLLAPLSLGASVVIATDVERKDPLKLLSLVKSARVTILDHVPSFWKGLESTVSGLDENQKKALFDLDVRLVAAGGENTSKEIVRFWFEHFKKNTEFFNIYGQTEGTGVVSKHKITETDLTNGSIPIGKPLKGIKVHVLDKNLRPVIKGEKGEICISGGGAAKGYWGKQSLTDECFVTRAFFNDELGKAVQERIYKTGDYGLYRQDGEIELLGRLDNQINIRGYRVELGEIEKAMCTHPLIDQAAIINRPNESGEAEIFGYFIAAQNIEPSKLIAFLLELIPIYMIPSRYVQLEEFPQTTSGKVDYMLLKSSDFHPSTASNTARQEPQNELQHRLKKVWESILNIKNIGINESFFDLGGNSLKAIELITSTEKEFGFSIAVEKLHQLSTIENMANDIKATETDKTKSVSSHLSYPEYKKLLTIILGSKICQVRPGSLILKLNEKGQRTPLFWCFNSPQEEMSALAKHLPEDQPLYGLISSVPLENTQEAIEKVAAHYADDLLELFPNGRFRLGGNCRGAKVMCEMVPMLSDRGVHIEKLCLLEFFHPNFYQFKGDLCLLFGRYSYLKRFKLVKFGKKGWDKPFLKTPMAEWIYCGHGLFFNEKNITSLSAKIRQWLYDEIDSSPPERIGRWDRIEVIRSAISRKLSRLSSLF